MNMFVPVTCAIAAFLIPTTPSSPKQTISRRAFAAAPGKVVEIADDEAEQVPGQPLVGVTVANAAGNHIIQDIGNGRFILYAHLRRCPG